MTDNIALKADSGEDIDIKEYCGCFTLDVIATVAFGLELDSLKNPNSEFVTNAKAVFAQALNKGALKYIFSALVMFPFLFKLIVKVTPDSSALIKPWIFYQAIIEDEIKRRREGGKERPDFLQMIMHLEKDPSDPANKAYLETDEFNSVWLRNGLTRGEVISQALVFFLAGYETTANVLSLTLFCLAVNPDCQQKLLEEINAKLPVGAEVGLDSLHELKYMDMCINETLRFYTPLSRIDRTCTQDTQLGGYRVPKDMIVVIPIDAVHHDASLWPEPDKFDPERFASPENIPPTAFLPFGLGNRNCIGMRLAMLELKLALTHLVREFEFSVSPSTKLPPTWKAGGLRAADPPIYLKAKKREL